MHELGWFLSGVITGMLLLSAAVVMLSRVGNDKPSGRK